MFCDKPSGLTWCPEIPCNLILLKKHKFVTMTDYSDPISVALGKLFILSKTSNMAVGLLLGCNGI